ncbi:MAG: hypothetical protein RR709_10035 [Ruthenibacterium sp.]
MLIEQSIAKQYGVLPSAQEDLPYTDWAKLVSGLMDDTPLGRVVSVRSEKDRDAVHNMTAWQHQMRSDWNAFTAKRLAQRPKQQTAAEMANLEKMIAKMFGGDQNTRSK